MKYNISLKTQTYVTLRTAYGFINKEYGILLADNKKAEQCRATLFSYLRKCENVMKHI